MGLVLFSRIILACGMLCAGQNSVYAENGEFYGVIAPAKIAGFERGEHFDFEKDEPGLGYGFRYLRNGWVGDVIIYNNGQPDVPDGANSERVKANFAQSLANLSSMDAAPQRVDPDEAFLLPSKGNRQFRCQSFDRTRQNGLALVSYVCLTGARGNLFKILLSAKAEVNDPQLAGRFIRAWRSILWP